MFERGKKRAQITVFVIVVIIIISATVSFFIFRKEAVIEIGGKPGENPGTFLNTCIKDKVREGVEVISLHGGYIDNPLHKNFKFENEDYVNISYLCYTQNNYVQCINQKPALKEDLRHEIKNYIEKTVKNCFDVMETNFLQTNDDASVSNRGFEVHILPKRIIIQTDSDISLTKSGETIQYENIKVSIASRLFEILSTVQELVNQEAEFCYAESLGIAITYPEFTIEKIKTVDTIIYSVEHEGSKEKFRFAIRTCVIPAGLVGIGN